jgi:hypothetical protein
MNKRKLLANSAAVGLVSMLPSRAIDARLASPSATGSGSSGVIDQLRAEHNSLTPPKRGSIPVAFPITHGAVIIDFCGPWEVFHSADIPGRRGEVFQTYTVAESLEPITASGGMKIVPNYTFETAPAPKVVVIPAQADPRQAMLSWVRSVTKATDVTMSVCTGAFFSRKQGCSPASPPQLFMMPMRGSKRAIPISI